MIARSLLVDLVGLELILGRGSLEVVSVVGERLQGFCFLMFDKGFRIGVLLGRGPMRDSSIARAWGTVVLHARTVKL